MASESSSAVLDLEADGDDTEAPSVTDDGEAVPLIMEHGYDIAVKVDAPMKQLSTLETYVTYRVRCACARWPTPPGVRRRYNHFKALHKRLSNAHPLIAVPPLPPLHSARQQLDRYSPKFVASRVVALNSFLERVAKHPILTHSEEFRVFVTTPDEELDKVFKSESGALNLWGLSSALYGTNENKATNGARVKDPEFTSVSDYLTSLQHKLNTVCALTNSLYKGSEALADEMMSMRRACDAWSACAGALSRPASALSLGARSAPHSPHSPLARQPAHTTLAMLAAYCAAHLNKIRQRDATHAAYIAGNSSSDELQNRLEQASEALRCELADWIPKTRTEIKSILVDIATRQTELHAQTLTGWENALRLCTETNTDQVFKTVSKQAVQNLSPSKCQSQTPTETERDVDDIDSDREIDQGDNWNGTNDSVVSDPLRSFSEVDLSS